MGLPIHSSQAGIAPYQKLPSIQFGQAQYRPEQPEPEQNTYISIQNNKRHLVQEFAERLNTFLTQPKTWTPSRNPLTFLAAGIGVALLTQPAAMVITVPLFVSLGALKATHPKSESNDEANQPVNQEGKPENTIHADSLIVPIDINQEGFIQLHSALLDKGFLGDFMGYVHSSMSPTNEPQIDKLFYTNYDPNEQSTDLNILINPQHLNYIKNFKALPVSEAVRDTSHPANAAFKLFLIYLDHTIPQRMELLNEFTSDHKDYFNPENERWLKRTETAKESINYFACVMHIAAKNNLLFDFMTRLMDYSNIATPDESGPADPEIKIDSAIAPTVSQLEHLLDLDSKIPSHEKNPNSHGDSAPPDEEPPKEAP